MMTQFASDHHARHGRNARVTWARLAAVLMVFPIAGCGSKISAANYYRVQYGMTEEEVEDLLGPAHQTFGVSSSTMPATHPAGVSKSWTRDGLTIHVMFENGVVTGRSAEGIPAEVAKPATQRVHISPT